MMGIVVPETCWASNKICNKNLCCIKLAIVVFNFCDSVHSLLLGSLFYLSTIGCHFLSAHLSYEYRQSSGENWQKSVVSSSKALVRAPAAKCILLFSRSVYTCHTICRTLKVTEVSYYWRNVFLYGKRKLFPRYISHYRFSYNICKVQ